MYECCDGWNVVLITWSYTARFDVFVYFQYPVEYRFQKGRDLC